MQVSQLDPVEDRLGDPHWQTSIIKETFWIKAQSEEHARQQAAVILLQMADMKPGHAILYSPWVVRGLADCNPDDPQIDVPDGIIVTIGGKNHS